MQIFYIGMDMDRDLDREGVSGHFEQKNISKYLKNKKQDVFVIQKKIFKKVMQFFLTPYIFSLNL